MATKSRLEFESVGPLVPLGQIIGRITERVGLAPTLWRQYLELCESPIETLMAIALVNAPWDDRPTAARFRSVRHHNESLEHFPPQQTTWTLLADRLFEVRERVAICPQVEIGPYRVDFAVVGRYGRFGDQTRSCIVECDGQEFHSTALQQMFDQRRQEYLESLGIPVVRFSGSRIYQEPNECACEVVQLIRGFIPLPPEQANEDDEQIVFPDHQPEDFAKQLAARSIGFLRKHRMRFGT